MVLVGVVVLAGGGAFAFWVTSDEDDRTPDGERGARAGDRSAPRGAPAGRPGDPHGRARAQRAELVGSNLPINPGAMEPADISAHNSPTLVRNPTDGANLVVASRVDGPRFSCAVHVSTDGGARWSQTPVPAPRGEEPKCHAPDAAFGADGTLYLSFVTLAGPRNAPHAAWVSRSSDGGRTLSTPRRALGPLSFQVRLMADPLRSRRLYLTWLDAQDVGVLGFRRAGGPIRFARSNDGGRSWSGPARVSEPARERVLAPSLATGARGRLYVLYLDVGDDRLDYEGAHRGRSGPPYRGRFSLVLASSRDGGRSWDESVVEDRLVPAERFLAFLPPSPSLAVDRERRRVYVAFDDGRAGDPDVRLWRSGPGGRRWKSARVNDTPAGDGRAQYLPEVAVAPNGRLDVLYYDRRFDPRNVMNEVSLQSSFDGGAGFTKRLRVSDRPFDSRIGTSAAGGMPGLGDRLALLSRDARSLAVWSDTRAGTAASGKQDLVRAVVAFSGP